MRGNVCGLRLFRFLVKHHENLLTGFDAGLFLLNLILFVHCGCLVPNEDFWLMKRNVVDLWYSFLTENNKGLLIDD